MDDARKRHNTTPYGFEHLVSTRVDHSSKFIRSDLSDRFDDEAVRRLARQVAPLIHPGTVWIINAWGVEPFDTRARQPLLDLFAIFKTAQGRLVVLLTRNRLAGMALQVGANHLGVRLKIHFEQKTFNDEIDRLKISIAP